MNFLFFEFETWPLFVLFVIYFFMVCNFKKGRGNLLKSILNTIN